MDSDEAGEDGGEDEDEQDGDGPGREGEGVAGDASFGHCVPYGPLALTTASSSGLRDGGFSMAPPGMLLS